MMIDCFVSAGGVLADVLNNEDVGSWEYWDALHLVIAFNFDHEGITTMSWYRMSLRSRSLRYGNLPVHLAAAFDNLDGVLALLDADSRTFFTANDPGKTPILIESESPYGRKVIMYLEHWLGFKVLYNTLYPEGDTADNGHVDPL